ncbi:hypothetical protein [Mahella sp.]|jgi:hypothetical protein|uniref:hypothetical protein n=1 Tax=Mahella sp. TaxID=2798721 RepID=UPI0025BA1443|nr:hypothetical protein [Mahella sp.]MBZ4666741.1 hypothetical protein [Mahella sp.]
MATVHQLYDKRLYKLKKAEEVAAHMIGKKITDVRSMGKEEFAIELDDSSNVIFERDGKGNIECHWQRIFREESDDGYNK